MRCSSVFASLVLSAGIVSGTLQADSRIGATTLRFPLSVQQMAMGSVSLGGNDVLRAWTNPAILAHQETQGQAALTGGALFGGLQKTGGLGAGWKLKDNLTVGGLLSYHTISVSELDLFGDPVGGDLGQSTIAAGITGAYQRDWLALGTTLKYVSESIDGDSASSVATDLGAIVSWQDFSVGISGRNLGQALRDESGVQETLPVEARIGVGYSILADNPLTGAFAMGIDYVMPKDQDPQASLGWAWWPGQRHVGLRLGVTGLGAREVLQMTGGLSIIYQGIGIDYALGTHPLGTTNRVNLSYAFGGKS